MECKLIWGNGDGGGGGANRGEGLFTWYTGFVFRYLVPLGFNDQGQAVNLYDLGM